MNTVVKANVWSRLRAPLSLLAVAGLFGVAVVAPFSTGDTAEAAPLPNLDRIHQKFVPNDSEEQDLVYADVPIETLPDPEEEQRRLEAEEAEKKAAAAAQSDADPGVPRYTGGGSPAEWMAAAGIAEADWGYVDYIATRESGWNPNATNASSGACGIIQAYPCSKVPGSGYNPIDNLRWADGYAKGRYGSWGAAYAFWTSNHWW